MLADRMGWIGAASDEDEVGEESGDIEDEDLTRPRVRRQKKPKHAKPVKKPPPSKTKAPPKPKAKPLPARPSIEMPRAGDIRAPRLPAGVTAGDISDTVATKGGDMRRCLDKSAKAGEKIKGTVYVHLTIDQWGKISEAHIKDREIDRSVLGRCILGRIDGGGYPPAGNSPVTVTFPIRIVRPN